MKRTGQTVAGIALAALMLAAPHAARAEGGATMRVGETTIKVGGGTQRLTLPDIEFFKTATTTGGPLSLTNRLETNDLDGEYGFSINGEIAVPIQDGILWGDAVAVRGFYGNVEDDENRSCTGSTNVAVPSITSCGYSPLVNTAASQQIFFPAATTLSWKADREVTHWGASAEIVDYFGGGGGLKDEPASRQAYYAIGFDVRAIDQDTDINGSFNFAPVFNVTYNEDLDTTYYGIYAAYGQDFRWPIIGNLGASLGIISNFRVWGGVYYADTDYSGALIDDFPGGANNQTLSLSEDDVAFIGGITLESRLRLSERTTLSLKGDYVYYSWVPDMSYNDAASVAGGGQVGPNTATTIDNDDAFSMRTTLNLTIAFGPREVLEPLK